MSKKMMFDEHINSSKVKKPFRICFCLLLAWVLIRCFSIEKIRIILNRRKNSELVIPMTLDEARISYQNIQKVKRWLWLRLACLETSLALVVFAYFEKKTVDFCVGVKLYSFESHAWVEVDGVPIEESEIVKYYNKILVI